MDTIKEALTFDDVTLAPNYSEILPNEVNTSTNLTKNLSIRIPLLSSAMDTVTESSMSIAIAKAGGLGIIHRNLNINDQIKEIRKVKSKKINEVLFFRAFSQASRSFPSINSTSIPNLGRISVIM